MKEKLTCFLGAALLPLVRYGEQLPCTKTCTSCQGTCGLGFLLVVSIIGKVIYHKCKLQFKKDKGLC